MDSIFKASIIGASGQKSRNASVARTVAASSRPQLPKINSFHVYNAQSREMQ